MPRLFVAVEMPEHARDALEQLCFGLPGVRWVPRDQLHLTLRFIGEVDGGTFEDIREALIEIATPAFRMSLAGLGCFPPRGEPKVAWAGVKAGPALDQLHRAVERIVRRCGAEPEERKFHAHVTLARLRDTPARRVAEWLGAGGGFATSSFPVTEVALFSSILGRQGAAHRREAAYPLVTEGVDLGDGELA